ncbi:MAG TPA: hypothetical protein VFG45_08590 [Candidatus Nitrosocosmicus sp.]|nr:hypothetical protein [Candidatus Nitrosocosmicus sp.]
MSNNNIQDYVDILKDSPAKVYGELVNEMLRSHAELNNYNKYMKNNLFKLQQIIIVSESETKEIIRIIDVITSDKDFEEKRTSVIDIYNQILKDNTGPIARVISCIAADSAKNRYDRPSTPSSIKSDPVLGVNVSGALIGATLGLNAGGINGAILGALIGASVASSIT